MHFLFLVVVSLTFLPLPPPIFFYSHLILIVLYLDSSVLYRKQPNDTSKWNDAFQKARKDYLFRKTGSGIFIVYYVFLCQSQFSLAETETYRLLVAWEGIFTSLP